jgi:serine/threonine-protein kinase PRP4
MYKAGRKEIEILKKLAAEDPEGKRHICKLLSHFVYKNHLCMVFIPAEMNLRKLLKTYGR